MDYLPLFHDLKGRRCLVVGGGETALRKVRPLLEAGAVVEVVAPVIDSGLRELAASRSLVLVERAFEEADLEDKALVVAAGEDDLLDRRVSALCQARNLPVNVVDKPDLCSVIFPAIVDRSPIQIAIGTGGSAPVLARLLRGRLEAMLPGRYGDLARLADRFRGAVREKLEPEKRRAFWEQVLEGKIAELVYTGRNRQAEAAMNEALEEAARRGGEPVQGEVYLVGGGPGDPDLLTFRALRLMQQADIVIHDRLVSKEVLDLVRRDAERLYVGKTAGNHPVTQDNINRKLVEYAQKGYRVLRLKGGDPFIFGRGGEEIEHLADHGIAFQVVPGITAASGCASYAGIPLTHRDHAQSVRFIAGHRRDDQLDLDWAALVTPGETLVFYMGLNNLETICRQLAAHGMAADTPAALVEKGTTDNQRVFTGDLATLPEIVRRGGGRAPTLIIVGSVVSLHNQLKWFGE
jgi:uroporphyrin-III C-methyltransferase/precorrin-2 dehydrogenase/sirohydrochlorin ferrochelatase